MKQGDTWWRFQAVLLWKNDGYIFYVHCILRSRGTCIIFDQLFFKNHAYYPGLIWFTTSLLVSFGAPGPLRMAPPKRPMNRSFFYRLRSSGSKSLEVSRVWFGAPRVPKKMVWMPGEPGKIPAVGGLVLGVFLGAGKYEGVFFIVIVNSAHSLGGNPVSCKSTFWASGWKWLERSLVSWFICSIQRW